MKPISVKVFVESNSAHTTQFYSGLYLLQDKGEVNVSLQAGHFTNGGYIRLEINNIPVFIDLADHHFIDEKLLKSSNFYFKRMLLKTDAAKDEKLQAYGLNYPVYYKNDQTFRRSFFSQKRKNIFNSLLRSNSLLAKISNIDLSHKTAQIEHFESGPLDINDPKVLFSARLWLPEKGNSVEKQEQRRFINEQRIAIVKEGRKRLGNSYVGGIDTSEYAKKIAPDALVSSNTFSHKKSYLQTLKQCSIGIANAGLEDSIGFKLAEYVCMSKAIVTSPLSQYLLPGNFTENSNYLTFDNTAEDCINKCEQLISDKKLRLEMMNNNQDYYKQYLQPDKLVMNIIKKVIGAA